jgi:hypothetical protein
MIFVPLAKFPTRTSTANKSEFCGTPVKDTAIFGHKHVIRLRNKFTFKEIKYMPTFIRTKEATSYDWCYALKSTPYPFCTKVEDMQLK